MSTRSEFRLGSVVLIEIQWGFAFFSVTDDIFRLPKNMVWSHFTSSSIAHEVAIHLRLVKMDGKSKLLKLDDKSVMWDCGGRVRSIAKLAHRYSCLATRFIVENEKLRCLLKSNLGIDCFNDEDICRQVIWGLKNAAPYLVNPLIEDVIISPQCCLPPCKEFYDLMNKYKITCPKDVDEEFLSYAGSLQQIVGLRQTRCTEMRAECDKLVPGVDGMIKDNSRYVEVMAKILTPSLFKDWDQSKWSTAGEAWFTADELDKILAADAAAGDARKKLHVNLAVLIEENLHDYRSYPVAEVYFLNKLRSYGAKMELKSCEAKATRGQKRSHKDMAEDKKVEAAGVLSHTEE